MPLSGDTDGMILLRAMASTYSPVDWRPYKISVEIDMDMYSQTSLEFIAQAGLKLVSVLPRPPVCGDLVLPVL